MQGVCHHPSSGTASSEAAAELTAVQRMAALHHHRTRHSLRSPLCPLMCQSPQQHSLILHACPKHSQHLALVMLYVTLHKCPQCTAVLPIGCQSQLHLAHPDACAWCCSALNTTKATQATTGTTVANAISGVISSFGGYGLNNPTIVSFANCTVCTPSAANLSDYSLTMSFAYSPGFTFTGLSNLFYAAFNASLFQVRSRPELHAPPAHISRGTDRCRRQLALCA